MRKLPYFLINVGFIGAALLLIDYSKFASVDFSIVKILILIGLFIVIHAIKFLRMYLIVLEELLPFREMLKLYAKTAFVSTVLPYKSGELFKMYSYGAKIGDYPKGIAAILIEKFFDALALCLVFIPYIIFGANGVFPPLVIIMLMFLAVILAIYYTSEPTCKYLNKFLITKARGRKSVVALRGVNRYKRFYQDAKGMIRGRAIIYVLLGLLAWAAEGLLLVVLSDSGGGIRLSNVAQYISDGFFGAPNADFSNYVFLCMVIFGIIVVSIYAVKLLRIIRQSMRKEDKK